MIRTKEYLRFKWSHHLPLHRLAVRTFNAVMRLVPFAIKYGVGKKLREKSPPYCLIEDGSVVVQVGAPQDTLHAGRSRGMYFSLFAGPKGKAIIVEPDADSIRQLDTVTKAKGIQNVILCHTAVWSERKMLRVFVNDAHPASNFTEGTKEYDARRLKDYRIVEVPADTIDNILAENGVEKVDLVSITTNGAEREILAGMRKTIEAGLPYISLARTGDHYVEMMESLGYKLSTHDDRGFTFKQERVLV